MEVMAWSAMPKGRVVWMDVFDIDSCCQKDGLENVTGFGGGEGSWIATFVRAPEEFTKGMGFIPKRCRTCGRYWFKVPKGLWTVKT